MPLRSLVTAALRGEQSVQQKEQKYEYKKPLPRYIVADSKEWEKKQKPVDWLQCKHLKQADEKSFCTKFCSLCAKEKCSQKNME